MIDYEFLRGLQNDTVVKKLCVASACASGNFRFKNHYMIADYGSTDNGLNWTYGHIDYKELHKVINEVVAGFAHLYPNGVSKCTFLAGLTCRPFHNSGDLNCSLPDSLIHDCWCTLPCHTFPRFACGTKRAHSLTIF